MPIPALAARCAKVQKHIQANKQSSKLRTKASSPSLLAGMVYLDDGTRLTPSHTNKHGKRYRYYCPGYQRIADQGKTKQKISLPAHDLETLIEREWKAMLNGQELKDRLAKDEESGMESARQLRLLTNTWDDLPLPDKIQRFQEADVEIKVSPDKIMLSANPGGIIERRIHPLTMPGKQKKPSPITKTIQANLYVFHGEKKIVEPSDQTQNQEQAALREQLLRRITTGRAWANELIEGSAESAKSLAQRERKSESYIYDILRAGCLSPSLVDEIVDSPRPVIDLESLMTPISISWDMQSKLLNTAKR